MFSKYQLFCYFFLILTITIASCKNDDFDTKSLNHYLDKIKYVGSINDKKYNKYM